MNIVEEENNVLKDKCNTLEHGVEWLDKSTAIHDNLIYTNGCYLHRNNVRIVGIKHSSSENCIEIARKLLNEITNKDFKIELSHRNTRKIHGKDRHILVKLSFYQDKMDVMKNVKHALRGKSVPIVDDLTPLSLKEKKRYI